MERPGRPDLLVGIESYTTVDAGDARALKAFVDAWDRPAEALLLSRDKSETVVHGVRCVPWERGVREIIE